VIAARPLAAVIGTLLALGSSTVPARAAERLARVDSVVFHHRDVALAGTLYVPAGSGRRPAVVAFHAAGAGRRDDLAYRHLVAALPSAGIAVLLFDRRGSGESGGDFAAAKFEDLARDGIAAIEFLKMRPDIDPARIGVWGVSQGGWLAPLAASLTRDVAFVVAVSGPGVTPKRQMDYAAEYALEAAGAAPEVVTRALHVREVVNDYYRGFRTMSEAQQEIDAIRLEPWFALVMLPNAGVLPVEPKGTKWFAEMDYDPLEVLARVEVPTAFFFAKVDPWVPVEESIAGIRRAMPANPAVTIRRIPHAGHYMETGTGETSESYVKQLLQWLRDQVKPR
jgi:dienelactone hydrolase